MAFVEQGLINRQYPQLRKRFLDQGEAIRFGRFAIEPEGLRYGRHLLPWQDVHSIAAKDGRITVRKRSRLWLDWCKVKCESVPNCCLFLALAEEQVRRQQLQG
jgi:hypothetical protein